MTDAAKEKRLQLLREIGRKHREHEALQAGGIPITKRDVQEEALEMDSFREARRVESVKVINSDEK